MGKSIIACEDTSGEVRTGLAIDFRDGEYCFLVGEAMTITQVDAVNISMLAYKKVTEAETAWKNIPLSEYVAIDLTEYVGQQVIFRAETTGDYCSAYFHVLKKS